jgi:hypothetical protein
LFSLLQWNFCKVWVEQKEIFLFLLELSQGKSMTYTFSLLKLVSWEIRNIFISGYKNKPQTNKASVDETNMIQK